MNRYLVRVPKYFGGYGYFNIEAENKVEALIKAKGKSRIEGSGNYKSEEVKVIKKLKKDKK